MSAELGRERGEGGAAGSMWSKIIYEAITKL